MKLLVMGASGMAGHVVATFLQAEGHTVNTLSAHRRLNDSTHLIDVLDQKRLSDFLRANKYDAVINCIGLLVAQSEERKDMAVYINSYLPRFLEHTYSNTKTRVIHLSTDGVFSGNSQSYCETDKCDSQTFYGQTKMLGEINNDKDTTIRMSIIGPSLSGSSGLFDWFLGHKDGGQVKGYSNVMWHGVTTLELAKAIQAILSQKITGICHLASRDGISKFELLRLINEVFGRNIRLEPTEGSGINTNLIGSRSDFVYQAPSYKIMLNEIKQWVDAHPDLYGRYL